MRSLEIASQSHPYRVQEAGSVAEAVRETAAAQPPFVLLDRKVAELYREPIAASVPQARIFLIDANETSKSYEQLTPVFTWLLESKCQRSSHLVVVGGGVLQDIGCFIASVLMRGIRWTLLPTTLLAQCDSCIGSKSSLNIAGFKNQLGTFYAPHEIRIASEFLGTLARPEIESGLGEAIKIHLVDSEASAARLFANLARVAIEPFAPLARLDVEPSALLSRADAEPLATLREIVWDSLAIKKRFIEEDELDRGVRNLLNYGHTFAHAFESATHYAVPHGIAVTLGVACATYASEQLGMLAAGEAALLRDRLSPFFGGHAATIAHASRDAMLSAMRFDKKNQGDAVTFILTRGAGRMEKRAVPLDEAGRLLDSCLAFVAGTIEGASGAAG